MNAEEYLKSILLKRDYADNPRAVHEDQKEPYKRCVDKLKQLEQEGKIDLTYDDWCCPFVMHDICIKWRLVEEYVQMDSKVIVDLLSGLDGTITIAPYDATDWVIIAKLYD